MTNEQQLAAVEAEIAAIQSRANELLDQLQTTTRAEAKVLKASADWRIVERWSELNTLRAKLREAVDIDSVIAHPDWYAE
jgi:ElaB/YqjD/DUF883 family membrane-anchored ribosome-binding protein